MGACFSTRAKVLSSSREGSGNSSSDTSPKKRSSKSSNNPGSFAAKRMLSLPAASDRTSPTLRAFSFADLKAATRNFRSESLLGEGGFGCVYKGFINEQTYLPARPRQGMPVAVKKLNLDGLQGHKEWLTEVHFLGALHHPNLVKLIGFCAEDDHRLLVYEFMQRGSLENHLFRKGTHYQTVSWADRLKIAIDAARGLAFLHDAEQPVIYRDFKASNILLDSYYNAKLSDFGLAKDGPTGENTHVSTRVMGTQGYAAPEYVATGHLTAKNDVYSFGVVLLEILTGLKAFDKSRPLAQQSLVEWTKPYLSDRNRVLLIVDKRIQGQYSQREVQRAADIAQCCLCPDAKYRPTMRDVLRSLETVLFSDDLSMNGDGNTERESSNRQHNSGT
ncbi:hypothetical protein KP509_30G050800 [Ceratopteris richardii]|uniref:non-specific serine/threonine protein kinase n=2 Tax=Ceratopteris richardii TaxID=49495 RepID=A0A8T2R3C9_CERRI|nr:hypothetical protein KP509_30G050800 [Ceratopteris richardii]